MKHPLIEHLAEKLLNVFVSIEMTGQSVQFEQKFNYRRPMYMVLEHIWGIAVHREGIKVGYMLFIVLDKSTYALRWLLYFWLYKLTGSDNKIYDQEMAVKYFDVFCFRNWQRKLKKKLRTRTHPCFFVLSIS